jgi:hypothetical protein
MPEHGRRRRLLLDKLGRRLRRRHRRRRLRRRHHIHRRRHRRRRARADLEVDDLDRLLVRHGRVGVHRVEAARHNDVAVDVVDNERSAGERARRRQQQRGVGAEHAVVATKDVDRVDRTLLARRKVGRKHGGARVETVAANDEDERRRLDERHVRGDAVGHRRQRHHRQWPR